MSARMDEYRNSERVAQPAMDRGHCITRAEYRACSAVYRRCSRWSTAYYTQQARSALQSLPHEGPGARAYFLAVVHPNAERRYARWVRIHGEPGSGSPND